MYAAFIIGLVGGAAYLAGLRLMRLLQVDDPVHIAAVHLLPGIWGAIAPGIFATPVSRTPASSADVAQSTQYNVERSGAVFQGHPLLHSAWLVETGFQGGCCVCRCCFSLFRISQTIVR
jgi:ammonia channel protein AmtB